MSNRFHNKWHRRNHHTYGNSENPDAGHDPIASQEQPFLGEFVLSGSLSAVAPASAYAAFLYSNNTALCAWAGDRGAYIFSGGPIGAEIYSTRSTAISAYGPVVGLNVSSSTRAISANGSFIGLDVRSNTRAISAFGNSIGLDVYSNTRAISAFGNSIGLDVYSNTRAISAFGRLYGMEVSSPVRAISANGNFIGLDVFSNNKAISAYGRFIGLEVASPTRAISANSGFLGADIRSEQIAISAFGKNLGLNTSSLGVAVSATGLNFGGIFSSNNVCLSTAPLSVNSDGFPDISRPYFGPNYKTKNVFNNRTGIFTENPLSAFHVTGGSLFDGNMTITGDLSVAGNLTRLDTYVFITSSVEINVQNNSNTTPALLVANKGNNKIIAAYDGDVANPALIVDGDSSRPGYIGMGVLNPAARLSINNDPNTLPQSITNSTGTTVHVTQLSGVNNRLLLDSFGYPNVARPAFTGRHAGVTSSGNLSGVPVDSVLCEITGQGYGLNDYSITSRGRMTINSAEVWTNSAQGTYLTFQTTPIGGTNTAEMMRVSDNGNVGIGTNSPSDKLHINNGNLRISNSSEGGQISLMEATGGGGWEIDTDGTASPGPNFRIFRDKGGSGTNQTALVIQGTTGNVGIGLTNPSEKLTISGNVSASNNVIASNNLTVGNSITSRFLNLIHGVPNDGVNPVFFIGERGDGNSGTINGSISGFDTIYDERSNRYGIVTDFGDNTVFPATTALSISLSGNLYGPNNNTIFSKTIWSNNLLSVSWTGNQGSASNVLQITLAPWTLYDIKLVLPLLYWSSASTPSVNIITSASLPVSSTSLIGYYGANAAAGNRRVSSLAAIGANGKLFTTDIAPAAPLNSSGGAGYYLVEVNGSIRTAQSTTLTVTVQNISSNANDSLSVFPTSYIIARDLFN